MALQWERHKLDTISICYSTKLNTQSIPSMFELFKVHIFCYELMLYNISRKIITTYNLKRMEQLLYQLIYLF